MMITFGQNEKIKFQTGLNSRIFERQNNLKRGHFLFSLCIEMIFESNLHESILYIGNKLKGTVYRMQIHIQHIDSEHLNGEQNCN